MILSFFLALSLALPFLISDLSDTDRICITVARDHSAGSTLGLVIVVTKSLLRFSINRQQSSVFNLIFVILTINFSFTVNGTTDTDDRYDLITSLHANSRGKLTRTINSAMSSR